MNGALDILKRERDDAAEQIRTLRLRIRDLEAAISVLDGYPTPTPARQGRSLGNIKQGVLDLLAQHGETGATPKELTEALTKLGHATSEPSVSSTLSRLKADSKVGNRGGRWFAANLARPQSPEQSPQKSGSSQWDDLDDDVPF